jgi:hypothetical protein
MVRPRFFVVLPHDQVQIVYIKYSFKETKGSRADCKSTTEKVIMFTMEVHNVK